MQLMAGNFTSGHVVEKFVICTNPNGQIGGVQVILNTWSATKNAFGKTFLPLKPLGEDTGKSCQFITLRSPLKRLMIGYDLNGIQSISWLTVDLEKYSSILNSPLGLQYQNITFTDDYPMIGFVGYVDGTDLAGLAVLQFNNTCNKILNPPKTVKPVKPVTNSTAGANNSTLKNVTNSNTTSTPATNGTIG